MNGDLLRHMALTSYLNAALGGRRGNARFFPRHPATLYCEFISVAAPADGARGPLALVASNPDDWADLLHREGFQRARLIYGKTNTPDLPDHIAAAFAGGGASYRIALEKPGRAELWGCREALGDRNAPDGRLWRVMYHRLGTLERLPEVFLPPALQEALKTLEATLIEIRDFARRVKERNFTYCFERALALLQGRAETHPERMSAWFPPGWLSPAAHRGLAVVQAAWVFGGMGSWNDLGFDGQDAATYERLSAELYDRLNDAACAAVNDIGPLGE